MCKPGEKYRPSNGSEGMCFMAEFCDQCAYDAKYKETQDGADGCEIICLTMVSNASDEDYPPEWTYTEDGKPTCTKYLHEDYPLPAERCKRTEDMFN